MDQVKIGSFLRLLRNEKGLTQEQLAEKVNVSRRSVSRWETGGNLLHEADITKFVDIIDERMKECFPETNLKRIRTAYGCTQAELAQLSGVSLRSIQMYEQRNKDINKASVDTVYRLAKTLGCAMEDLIEK